jgi:hypothetical protein
MNKTVPSGFKDRWVHLFVLPLTITRAGLAWFKTGFRVTRGDLAMGVPHARIAEKFSRRIFELSAF